MVSGREEVKDPSHTSLAAILSCKNHYIYIYASLLRKRQMIEWGNQQSQTMENKDKTGKLSETKQAPDNF